MQIIESTHIPLADRIQALDRMEEPELRAQEITQQGAVHAVSTLLNTGCTEARARDMLDSLLTYGKIIREALVRRGVAPLFEENQVAAPPAPDMPGPTAKIAGIACAIGATERDAITFQTGSLLMPGSGDPEFDDEAAARDHAIALSEKDDRAVIGVWTGQGHGSELLYIVHGGEIFRK
jgi:hypothetical protein